MIASSVFVLSALTMTGIYMKSNQEAEQDDGYTLDFTALEDSVEDKYEEIAQNVQSQEKEDAPEDQVAGNATDEADNLEDDLDYLPMEVGSGTVTIPGLTDRELEEAPEGSAAGREEADGKPVAEASAQGRKAEAGTQTEDGAQASADATEEPQQEAENADSAAAGNEAADAGAVDSAGSNEVEAQTLHFAESEGLLRPVSGEVLIPFSMDSSVYFSTLDQFKYKPALMIAAETGAAVSACAAHIEEERPIGPSVTVEAAKTLEVTVEAAGAVRADRAQLERLTDNLLRNACHYAQEGTAVDIAARTGEDGAALLSFTNRGVTIPPDKLGRIFEQFFRLDSSRATHTGGAGLGLAIAKEILELHGGSIAARSEEGVTTFTVRLPAPQEIHKNFEGNS